jgi:guanylate kinase
MSGKLVILSGPSGVGKDTVIDHWREKNPKVQRVVAYTTRAPRNGEVDGLDYNFVSVDRFKQLADEGAFLEWKEVYGNYYATPLRDMEMLLADGNTAILKIDVQGALTAMDLRPDAITIFILPPDLDELERRIHSRALDTDDSIVTRQQKAMEEIRLSGRYQHRVKNDDLERVVCELQQIVDSA